MSLLVMDSLIFNLGLDWKLLLSQAVNFAIVLVILRLTVYKPLLKIMHERSRKIETGLEEAADAKRRLEEISNLQRKKIKEAEEKGLQIIAQAGKDAKAKEAHILAEAAKKEEELIKRAHAKIQAEEQEIHEKLGKEAAQLVKRILTKVVQVAPDAIDEALIVKVAHKTRIGS